MTNQEDLKKALADAIAEEIEAESAFETAEEAYETAKAKVRRARTATYELEELSEWKFERTDDGNGQLVAHNTNTQLKAYINREGTLTLLTVKESRAYVPRKILKQLLVDAIQFGNWEPITREDKL